MSTVASDLCMLLNKGIKSDFFKKKCADMSLVVCRSSFEISADVLFFANINVNMFEINVSKRIIDFSSS